MRVLVIGGYGFFGGRLARLLAENGVNVVIGGRDFGKAQTLAAALPGAAAALIDRDAPLTLQLAAIRPDVVIDASGPFDAYGEDPYRVIRESLACGAHYLDLADSGAFIEGVVAFDAVAKATGLVALSGLSTVPALSGAALRALGMERFERADVGIAPSPFAGFGLSVMRMIAACAGAAVTALDGRLLGVALVDRRVAVISPPGSLPLRARTFSLIQRQRADRPDLPNVRIFAGTTPESLHLVLNNLARLVRWRLLPNLAPLAPLLHWTVTRFRWGEHRGGMFVEATGWRAGRPARRTWSLVVEGEDGPSIPTLAAAAVVRAIAAGRPPSPGGRSAAGELELSDFQPLFADRAIVHGVRDEPQGGAFRRVLAGAFEAMPAPLQALHADAGDQTFEGRASIERGRGLLAALVCGVIGFPRPGADVPAGVAINRADDIETWRRTFGGRAFVSRLSPGRGRWDALMQESFGPITLAIALVLEGQRLRYVVRGWKLFGVPLPNALALGGETCEHAADGRFNFDVEITAPIVGLIVRYRGWLEPTRSAA